MDFPLASGQELCPRERCEGLSASVLYNLWSLQQVPNHIFNAILMKHTALLARCDSLTELHCSSIG